ncbi:MAG: hypothetical protein MZV63_38655 [Marinilabiliales bacterium]|nr:hypothetical protein [Marinilabiliales bacterium]
MAKVAEPMKFTPEDENRWELYDLESDPSETVNLAGKYPDRVKKMAAKWEEEAITDKSETMAMGQSAGVTAEHEL